MSETFSHLAKEIAHDAGVELDFAGLEKVREVFNRIGPKWPEQCVAVLKEKNQPLLDKLASLESQLDSLLLIPHKPAVLVKEFKARLEEYEHTIEMCIEYSNRHIPQ